MTRFEEDPTRSSARPVASKRISKGSGRKPEAVAELVQKFLFMHAR
jgi:signal recognition particle GTPase